MNRKSSLLLPDTKSQAPHAAYWFRVRYRNRRGETASVQLRIIARSLETALAPIRQARRRAQIAATRDKNELVATSYARIPAPALSALATGQLADLIAEYDRA